MDRISHLALIAGFLGMVLGAVPSLAHAGPASHLNARPLKGKPGKITPLGTKELEPGKPVTAFDCQDPCIIPIRVIYVPATAKEAARCDFNYEEVALTVIPRAVTKVFWRVEAWTQSKAYKFSFVPSNGTNKNFGIVIADNTEPVDPNDPMGTRRSVWMDDDKASTATQVVKPISTTPADRRFKASSFTAYVQWETKPPTAGPVACNAMDPIIMNNGD